MPKLRLALMTVAALTWAGCVAAASEPGYKVVVKPGTYEDVRDNVKDAIIGRGFVIDYVGQFNDMLERTAEATGSVTEAGRKSPYRKAEYMQFCPSKLTHEAVSASPFAIANCPIAIFVYELGYEPGKINVGYRLPLDSPSKRVREVNAKLEAMLAGIVAEATK